MSGPAVDQLAAEPDEQAVEPARRPWGMRALGVLGELLITAGVVVLLFVVYELLWTNVEADRRADALADDLRRSWQTPAPAGPTSGADSSPEPVPGEAIALMRIPRLGDDWVRPIIEGVTFDDLAKGIGYYPDTSLPGEVGNFAVAGHRATNGEPFRDIDRIRPGDEVIVETRDAVYTYVVDRHEIVDPQDVWVLDPVPGRPQARPNEELLTLTSCEPRWASYRRWIVFGHLASVQPRNPAAQTQPAQTQPAQTQPAQTQPAQTQPAPSQPLQPATS